MKKTLTLILILAVSFGLLQAQKWFVYDASVMPQDAKWSNSSSSPGPNMVEEIIDDPVVPGNKLFHYQQLDPTGTRAYKFNYQSGATKVTSVFRVKGIQVDSLNNELALAFDSQVINRNYMRLYTDDSIVQSYRADGKVSLDANLEEWHIYRMAVNDTGRVDIYFDEDPTPVFTGKSTEANTQNYVRFGDWGSERVAGLVDWVLTDSSGAYAPGEGAPIPEGLVTTTGKAANAKWFVYDASIMPQDAGWSNSSSSPGPNMVEEIIDDPVVPGNKLFHYQQLDPTGTRAYKFNYQSGATKVTSVFRVKGIQVDSLNNELALAFDSQVINRNYMRLYTDDSIVQSYRANGIVNLDANLEEWHIYRMAVNDTGRVDIYFDEDPTPIFTGKSTEANTQNYVRFGDWGSERVAGLVDWVLTDSSGAYAPGEGAPIPEGLVTSTGKNANAKWNIFDASVMPQDVGWSNSSSSPGPNMVEEIIPDPVVPGNKLFHYQQLDPTGTRAYKFNYQSGATKVTSVFRVKGIQVDSLNNELALAFDSQVINRNYMRLYTDDSIVQSYRANGIVNLDANLEQWHIYRMAVNDTGRVDIYFDEDPTPIFTGKSTEANTQNYVRFGDWGSERVAGIVDWVVTDSSGAYAPGEGAPLWDFLSTATGPDPISTNASLSELTADIGTLSPEFDYATMDYIVEVPEGTTSVTLSAVAADANANVSGAGAVDVSAGGDTATIVVTAENGYTKWTYTVIIKFAPSSDASLSGLTLDVGTLDPAFDPGIFAYTALVPAGTTSVTATATTTNANATVAGDGAIDVSSGKDTATIVVTAEDGVSQQTYEVIITVSTGVEKENSVKINMYYSAPGDALLVKNASQVESVDIYSITGRKIISMKASNQESLIISTSALSKGVFLVQMKLSDRDIQTGKFVKY
jgi:hypothetical protein